MEWARGTDSLVWLLPVIEVLTDARSLKLLKDETKQLGRGNVL
ncbi:hypothetical protein [Niallia oryzisoli]